MNENYVTLGQVCDKGSSNIAQKDLAEREGWYPIYGAAGLIKNVDFAHQKQPYIAVVKDGAGIGRVMKLPAYSSVIGTMQYILPKKNVDIDYLFYALQHMNLGKYFSGSTIPHIYFRDYQKERLKLPAMKVQQHQAEVLGRIDALSSDGRKQIDLLDELVKSRFVEMFGGIHDSVLYPYMTVDSFTKVTSGGTPDRNTPSYWENGKTRWVKTTELQNCVICDTEEKITDEGVENSSAKMVPANTILIAMYGQGKTRGMTGYLAIEGTTNQACACILPSEEINQRYLWQYMILSYDKLRSMAKGGNQPNLNAGIIKSFPVLVPPLELQNRFAAFVAEVDKSKFLIQKSLAISRMLWTLPKTDDIINVDFYAKESLI